MRRKGKNSIGQMAGEYVLLLFIVIGTVSAMTVYVKRLLQARIRDSREAMISTVRNYTYTDPDSGDTFAYNDIIYKEYEPYYGNRYSEVQTVEVQEDRLMPGLTTGISRQTVDRTTWTKTQSDQLPPGQSD